MLVDLGRNDVGRVAEFGSVRVTEFMQVERYSHVMHIVSNVTGRLRTGCSVFDAVRATFPAGTVSGAPKIRAMQIISELEKTRRGCYAGAIGYFGFDGNFDSCIALRCAVLKNQHAYFQAGAGIVADSDPQREYEETINKARAMMKALAMASQALHQDPNDPEVIAQARRDGIPEAWLAGARKSPIWKMVMEWKVALPLHPEYRTLPMVWYVPPLSPISAAANAGQVGSNGQIPDVKQLRIPVNYLANLLTAGDTAPVERALERMLAMRAYQRDKHVEGRHNQAVLTQVGLTVDEVEDMYQVMAIANYEDRFVIPSTHREYAENTFNVRGGCGFSFGNGCSEGSGETSLFGSDRKRTIPIRAEV